MTEPKDTDRLLGFLDGDLDAGERQALLDEMQQDLGLRREFETLQALAHRVEELPLERVPVDFAEQFMARHAAPSLLERVTAWFQLPAARGFAVAGGLAVALLMVGGGGGDAPVRPEAGCTLVASAGTARVNGRSRGGEVALHLDDAITVDDTFEGELRYPDGTRITLKAGSQLVVKSRGLRLNEGGVWLEVTKDLRGFQVETPLALAAVKGTAFSVEVHPDSTEVFVKEGLVEVASAKNRKLLAAGKGARVGADEVVESVTQRGPHSMFHDQEEGDFRLGEGAR